MPRPIYYFQLSYPLKCLFQSIRLYVLLFETLEYYFTWIFRLLQKVTSRLEDLKNLIPYTLPLQFCKNCDENNGDIFSFNDLPSPLDGKHEKKIHQLCKFLTKDIIKAFEL